MSFIHEDFLLHSKSARELYHRYGESEPILDYHCHLPPKDIAEDRRFNDLYEIWLEGDHYKWRAMRANGVAGEVTVPETPIPLKSFWRGPQRFRRRCAIRSITGRIWN